MSRDILYLSARNILVFNACSCGQIQEFVPTMPYYCIMIHPLYKIAFLRMKKVDVP